MRVFDDIIIKTQQILLDTPKKVYAYDKAAIAVEGKKNELILSKEAAFELGEGNLKSVSYTLLTENKNFVQTDEVLVYGRQLSEINKNLSYARVVILRTKEMEQLEEQAIYNSIKSMEMIQYQVFPKGYMIRAAALSNRESVRVSKEAIKRGLTFEQVGNLFIEKYKKNSYVEAVKIIFITQPDVDYTKLNHLADSSKERIQAMNHLLADMKMDCKACEWKPVCDEVEGMKELHEKILTK